MTVEEQLYDTLKNMGFLDVTEYQKFSAEGFMDLHVDVSGDNKDFKQLALVHTYMKNGDLMADPDMEVRVDKKQKKVFPLSFQQDPFTFQRVYHEVDGKLVCNHRLKRELCQFLLVWLDNIEKQGFMEVKKE